MSPRSSLPVLSGLESWHEHHPSRIPPLFAGLGGAVGSFVGSTLEPTGTSAAIAAGLGAGIGALLGYLVLAVLDRRE